MGRAGVLARAVPHQAILLPAVLLCAFLCGCDNSCFVFVSNPSGGTLSVNTSTCRISNDPAASVRVRLSAPSERSEAWRRAGIEHVYLTVREVDARLSVAYGDGSAGWQEIAPNLRKQPLQIDLLSGAGDSSAATFFGEAAVPAGEYAAMRILLTPDHPASGEAVPRENACGGVSFNCVVTQDGDVHPVSLPGNERVLIPPARPARAVFHVFPGTATNLDVTFEPEASQISMMGSAAWLSPALATRCDFLPKTNEGIAARVDGLAMTDVPRR